MAEEREPPWKRNLRLVTPESAAKGNETKRAKASVREALLNAFDKLGNEAFFLQLGRGSAEDRRCLAMIYAKLIPIEVAGSVDHTLTVKIVKQVGEREIELDVRPGPGFHRPPRDAVTGERVPVVSNAVPSPLDGVAVVVPEDA